MSAIIDTISLSACSDCLLFVANGDEPEGDDTLPARIESEWTVSDYTCDRHAAVHGSLWWEIVCGGEHESEADEDGSLGFSWRHCECCGSTLGGDRYPLTAILRRKPLEQK
tara:strand:- start:4130 stop:4462 length:333 start_codon:yes stop_codon:yes gene_type:complete